MAKFSCQPQVRIYWRLPLYRLGIGVQKSDKASFLMIAQSALNGYGPAMLDLYYAFNRGLGTDKNKEQALRWLKGAASRGVEGAQALWEKENGVINYQTRGCKPNCVTAHD